jgi:hypothetical protein
MVVIQSLVHLLHQLVVERVVAAGLEVVTQLAHLLVVLVVAVVQNTLPVVVLELQVAHQVLQGKAMQVVQPLQQQTKFHSYAAAQGVEQVLSVVMLARLYPEPVALVQRLLSVALLHTMLVVALVRHLTVAHRAQMAELVVEETHEQRVPLTQAVGVAVELLALQTPAVQVS